MSKPYSLRSSENGLVYLDWGGHSLAICIPSRKRELAIRHCPLLPLANVFVHESELDAYRRSFAGAIGPLSLQTHTHTTGIVAIMNGMLERGFADAACEAVVRIDDDFLGLLWLWTRQRYKPVRDPEDLAAVLYRSAVMAWDAGAALFGFNLSGRPQARSAQAPFLLRSWLTGGILGVCDRELRVDPHLTLYDDVDISLEALRLRGLIWVDQRYFFDERSHGQGKDRGGLAHLRTQEVHDRDLAYLVEKWGAETVLPRWDEVDGAGLTRLSIRIAR